MKQELIHQNIGFQIFDHGFTVHEVILERIQTGIYAIICHRTGYQVEMMIEIRVFAIAHYEIQPFVICFGKLLDLKFRIFQQRVRCFVDRDYPGNDFFLSCPNLSPASCLLQI